MTYFDTVTGVLNLIIVVLGVFAVIQADGLKRLIPAAVLLALLFLPRLGLGSTMSWIVYFGKVIFGIGCYLYLKVQDFWSFGR